MKLLRLAPLMLFALSACYYEQPPCFPPIPSLFSIVSVQADGMSIQEVELTNFSYESEPSTPEVLFDLDERVGQGPEGGSTIENGVLTCQPVCLFGFDASEGQYMFDVSAPGFETKRIDIDAEYEDLPPSRCGNSKANKVELELTLEPLTN